MSTAESPLMVVVESREALDRLIEEAAVVVELESQAAKRAYEDSDWRLHLQVCDVMGVANTPTRSDDLVHVVEDWFPTRTKFIETDSTAFGPDQIEALRALLHGEFEHWRISVHIYRGLNSSKREHVGGVNIYSMRTLVQREALSYVLRAD